MAARKLPSKIRKPELLKAELVSLLSKIANLHGPIDYSRYWCANARYAYDFVIPWLVAKRLITYHPGYFKGEKDWRYSRISPQGDLLQALHRWSGVQPLPVPTIKKPWAALDDLNSFYVQHRIVGCAPPRLVRYIEKGNLHGRMYSVGVGNFTNLSFEQRSFITIDGEETAEPDLKASFLTILLSLYEPTCRNGELVGLVHDNKLIADPYRVDGFSRDEVKRFVNCCIGEGKAAVAWKDDDDNLHTFPKRLKSAVLKIYPFLTAEGFKELLGVEGKAVSKRLMFIESEVMHGAVVRLMEMGIVALPIHDGMRVPVSKVEVARSVIVSEFMRVCGIEPIISVKPNVVYPWSDYYTSSLDIETLIDECMRFYGVSQPNEPVKSDEVTATYNDYPTHHATIIATISQTELTGSRKRGRPAGTKDTRKDHAKELFIAENGISLATFKRWKAAGKLALGEGSYRLTEVRR